MCGIAGYLSYSEVVDPRLNVSLALMGVFMTDRGRQSWGWTNGTDITKNVGELRATFGARHLGHKQAMIHTRHGTGGAIIKENSHPFNIKGIIGAHNGIIYNHTDVAKQYDYQYAVDSELIFHHIAEGRDLSDLKGYGAIVFWRDGIFHIGRFQGGEMELVNTEFGWMYCSTKTGLVDGLGMAGLENTVKYEVDLKQGVLYQLIGDKIVKAPERLNISESNYKGKWEDYGKPVYKTHKHGFTQQGTHLVNSNASLPRISSASTIAAEAWGKMQQQSEFDNFYDPLSSYHDEEAWIEAAMQAEEYDVPAWKRDIRGPECDWCGFLLNGQSNPFSADVVCDDCYASVDEDDADYVDSPLMAKDFSRYTVVELTDADSLDCVDCGKAMRPSESAFVYENNHHVQICSKCYWENYSFLVEDKPHQHQLALVQ